MFEISYEKKNMNECNPELIEKLKNPNSELDFWDLAEEYLGRALNANNGEYTSPMVSLKERIDGYYGKR